ncbi:MAG: nucleoside hydrolase [Sphaerochaetaceae bacterium]|nr:nucleoside hydrolase [Sphaerochaetaceae bacterium]
MSGRFATGAKFSEVPEWNILCDIPAARKVYESRLFKQMICVGSDVTRQLVLKIEEAKIKLEKKSLTIILDMAKIWFNERMKMTLHDPLAGSIIFNNSICTYKRGYTDIDGQTGVTYWKDSEDGPITAVEAVNYSEFIKFFFSLI